MQGLEGEGAHRYGTASGSDLPILERPSGIRQVATARCTVPVCPLSFQSFAILAVLLRSANDQACTILRSARHTLRLLAYTTPDG
jgi:hypothetical protein